MSRLNLVNTSDQFLNILRRLKHRLPKKIHNLRINHAVKKILRETQQSVLSGPFEGLKLSDHAVFGSPIPKLLGCYEKELHPFFKEIINKHRRDTMTICNIGSAEGYYAIGFARLAQVKEVVIFEILEEGQRITQENAELNDVADKITIHGGCNPRSLIQLLKNKNVDLLVIDIEGIELDILTKQVIKHLGNSQLVVELHDFCRPNCTSLLIERLQDSHVCDLISAQSRTADDFPKTIKLPISMQNQVMDEERPCEMQWLIASPRTLKQ